MSVGKKKSGFQITSVTSDYEKEALSGGDAKGPSARPAGGPPDEPSPVENGGHHPNGGLAPKNGPSPPLHPASSVGGLSGGSRFRVVKLDHGLGEPYKRGRWTCRDFYEQEMDHHLVGRLADSARQPQSLDSRLEVAGLLAKPSSAFSPQMPRRGGPGLHSLLVLPMPAAPAHQARSLGGGLPVLRPGRSPTSPASLHSGRGVAETRPLAPEEGAQDPGDPPQPGAIPVVRVEEHLLLPKSVAQLMPRETEDRHKILPRETRSRPSSPAPLLFREASPHRRTSDPFGVARFNLARSVFGMGGSQDSDDDSGTNSSMIAIDNKIEQAMDLVKSHLMFAVREEVEVLREQIKELSERNAALEQENNLLRSLANPEQTGHFQPQLHENKPPGGSA